jgi:hypothetical protein
MASYDAVFGRGLNDDDQHDSSQDDDEEEEEEEEDLAENDDVLIDEDDDDENLDSPSPIATINNNSVVAKPDAGTVDGIYIPVHLPTATTSPAPSVRTFISNTNGTTDTKNLGFMTPIRAPIVIGERKPILDDSRRLFQRIWTDEDEIEILQGFLDYTTQRGGGGHHYDTTLFYDQIKSKLQLDFNKNQLVEKLRRLKKKYRTALSKIVSGKEFTFKSAHDQATFEISRKIWGDLGCKSGAGIEDNVLDDEDGNNVIANINLCNVEVKSEDFGGNSKSRPRKRARSTIGIGIDDKLNLNETFVANNVTNSNENSGCGVNLSGNENGNGSAGAVAAVAVEETIKSCLTPLFKELLSGASMGMGGAGLYGGGRGLGGLTMNPMLPSFGIPTMSIGNADVAISERWRKQQILELEVYSKRLELVQDQIKTALEELRSVGG